MGKGVNDDSRRNEREKGEQEMMKGTETFNEIKQQMEIVYRDGAKFYEMGNQSAGARARKALDKIAQLKVQWRKETCKK